MLYFKGFHAIQAHRLAHWFWSHGRRDLALYLQSRSSEAFQCDIHPAARIGRGIFLDHATGLVVGSTAVIEDDVSILHAVTLGGTGKQGSDRHPKIRHGVMIGAGAKILGNIEVGACARVAAGSVVLQWRRTTPWSACRPGSSGGGLRGARPRHGPDALRRDLSELIYRRCRAWRSRSRRRAVDVQEVKKLDAYLKKLFGNARVRVVPRPKRDDSAEVYVGDEFIGVLFVDDEDDERSYNFQMAILGSDLDG